VDGAQVLLEFPEPEHVACLYPVLVDEITGRESLRPMRKAPANNVRVMDARFCANTAQDIKGGRPYAACIHWACGKVRLSEERFRIGYDFCADPTSRFSAERWSWKGRHGAGSGVRHHYRGEAKYETHDRHFDIQ
jgi:hypothetical protein